MQPLTGHTLPALHGLTGGHGQEYLPLSDTALAGKMLMGAVFSRRMKRIVGVVLIPTLTTCRKLAMHLFCGGKKEGLTMLKLTRYKGAG